MSLAKVLAAKTVDEGLDDIFKSSAGPSVLVASSSAVVSSPPKRKADKHVEDKKPKKARLLKGEEMKAKSHDNASTDEKEEAISDDEDPKLPKHESLKKQPSKKNGSKKAKYVPESETPERRDERTIFIGNLPVSVVSSKSLTKQLKRHIISFVPTAKTESIRFRSVTFRNPTSRLEDDAEEKPSTKDKRQQKRAADWRAQHSEGNPISRREKEEIEEDKKGEKSYMMPAEKRRLAAIKGDLHEHSAATTNAYVVFAHPLPASETHVPRNEVMDPFAAALEAVNKVNGTFFAEHMLRVDLVRKLTDTTDDSRAVTGALTDPKLSVFVGNLDFASSEDDVRAFFEMVMCKERGNPDFEVKADDRAEEDEESEERAVPLKPTWVTRVRIVRDRETRLGKGFAYVQFSDRDCVDEMLALEADKLKFAKRTLRVQRCKTVPGPTAKSKTSMQRSTEDNPGGSSRPRSKDTGVTLPKGDPNLGKRLAGLSKESRKEVKAADPARLARRLAKKKAHATLEKASLKGNRVRERKDRKGKVAVNSGRKNAKKRERSERNTERKNMKKL